MSRYHVNTSEENVTIDAHSFCIDETGALCFFDQDDETDGAFMVFAPGSWKRLTLVDKGK